VTCLLKKPGRTDKEEPNLDRVSKEESKKYGVRRAYKKNRQCHAFIRTQNELGLKKHRFSERERGSVWGRGPQKPTNTPPPNTTPPQNCPLGTRERFKSFRSRSNGDKHRKKKKKKKQRARWHLCAYTEKILQACSKGGDRSSCLTSVRADTFGHFTSVARKASKTHCKQKRTFRHANLDAAPICRRINLRRARRDLEKKKRPSERINRLILLAHVLIEIQPGSSFEKRFL